MCGHCNGKKHKILEGRGKYESAAYTGRHMPKHKALKKKQEFIGGWKPRKHRRSTKFLKYSGSTYPSKSAPIHDEPDYKSRHEI